MVFRQLQKLSLPAERGPRITRVRHVDSLPHQQAHIGRASDRIRHLAVFEGLQPILNSQIPQQLLAPAALQNIIELLEGLL